MQKLTIAIASILFCISAISGKLPEPEPIPPEPTPVIAIDWRDYWEEHPEECPFERLSQILALAELAESIAPNANATAKEAVMQCVINRSRTSGFPNTIEEVCAQSNQWSANGAQPTKETHTIAENLVDKQGTTYIAVIPSNCVYMDKVNNNLEFRAEWNGEVITSISLGGVNNGNA